MSPPVFFGSALCVIAFCVFGGVFTETATRTFTGLQSWITIHFGWYYSLAVTAFVVFALWLLVSPYGSIRLGPPDARPRFGYASWFAMLFSAGMGTGLVFWGVAEPLYHYGNPLFADANTPHAAREAMQYTFFHWGLHPWAIYILFGVAIAYFHFRHELPLAPRSILHPLIGKRIHGPIGHGVDILCTVGTLLGVSTSLGLGAMQINSGIAQFMDVPQDVSIQVAIIAAITLVATISVVAGIKAGIRRLSMLNISLAFILMLFVLVAGPTVYIMEVLVGSLGVYLQNLPKMSLFVDFSRDSDWQASWTLFYWGWWISWSPFVGIFVARVSRGRTIREFVVSVMLVPTLVTFAWMAVFGGTALNIELFGESGLARTVQENVSVSLHALLQELPLARLTMMWATLVVVIFFITSSDSGSLVDDMVTSGGHPNPSRIQRIFWAVSEGSVAATLLIVGGLKAIQNASISLGFFMSMLLIAICFSLYLGLRSERHLTRAGADGRFRLRPWSDR
ncbi:choline/glycine/proline betaine transport protein [Marinobacter daqiaonensis]|uniref:Choline/glycine/proline betaine transport protein n=1 Tax=Marinobacter daqiaonensis TaxID=650891 RepID=A0A1I6HTA1_9GAMM|nr:BCCT family transporter [Marinobacter daqiaonensis]SFR57654.1 choline/glycine/proline betaine transport protein [Marinobacter daqiaonensis]